eukprot:s642_g9.t1
MEALEDDRRRGDDDEDDRRRGDDDEDDRRRGDNDEDDRRRGDDDEDDRRRGAEVEERVPLLNPEDVPPGAVLGEPQFFVPATKTVPHELEAVPGYRGDLSLPDLCQDVLAVLSLNAAWFDYSFWTRQLQAILLLRDGRFLLIGTCEMQGTIESQASARVYRCFVSDSLMSLVTFAQDPRSREILRTTLPSDEKMDSVSKEVDKAVRRKDADMLIVKLPRVDREDRKSVEGMFGAFLKASQESFDNVLFSNLQMNQKDLRKGIKAGDKVRVKRQGETFIWTSCQCDTGEFPLGPVAPDTEEEMLQQCHSKDRRWLTYSGGCHLGLKDGRSYQAEVVRVLKDGAAVDLQYTDASEWGSGNSGFTNSQGRNRDDAFVEADVDVERVQMMPTSRWYWSFKDVWERCGGFSQVSLSFEGRGEGGLRCFAGSSMANAESSSSAAEDDATFLKLADALADTLPAHRFRCRTLSGEKDHRLSDEKTVIEEPLLENLAAITTVAQARAWAGLAEEPWNALSASLGTVPTLQVLAYIPIFGFKEAIEDARVPVAAQGVPGEEGHVPATTRQLTMVEGTQAGLMLQVARLKFDREVVDPLAASATPATPGSQGALGQNQSLHRKIKNSQVIDQADEGEIPTLDHATLDEHYKVLREAKGGPVRPETEPSADQIAAMKARVLEMDLSPYADFAVFVNFQGRFSKAFKFLNHVLQPDGTFKAVEVSGPPNFDAWTLSWKVYVNTLLTLEVVVGTKKVSIASLSAMEEYHDMFRDLVKDYPEAWHLLVIAEDRCRGEHFPRVRRELEAQHDRGLAPNFEPKRPWDEVFRTAARDRDYWDRHVREPALLFRTAGKHKEQGEGKDPGKAKIVDPNEMPKADSFGHDIASDEGFLMVLETKADWKHMAPPCRTFTKARRQDAHGRTKRLRSEGHPEGFGDPEAEEANLLADRCAAIAEEQDEREDFFSIENPLDSFIWDLKSMKRLARRKGVQLTPLDQCAYGGPHQKATGVLHNTTWLAQGLRCGDAPPHQHTKLEGRVWSYKEDKEVRRPSTLPAYVRLGQPGGSGGYKASLTKARIKQQPKTPMDTSAGEEPEEGEHIGGMRNPRRAIRQSPTWQAWGEAANRALDEVARTTPGFDQLARSLGAEMTREQADSAQAKLTEIGAKAAKALAQVTGVRDWDTKGPTGWRWKLMESITKAAQDVDTDVAQWLRTGAPFGINRAITPRGVFPWSDTTKAQEASAEYLAALGDYGRIDRNYTSFHDNEQESKVELDRLIEAGHLEPIGSWKEVIARWPKARATKLATLVKARPDGTTKVRFIADMRRSGVNGMTFAEERIVLPRGTDFTKDILDLLELDQAEVELYTADFTDAFLNLPIDPAERQFAVVLVDTDQFAAYRGVPFGLATAPLVWGRMSAWLGRATQALHPPWQHRLQIYVDDPAGVVAGSPAERDRIISKTLALWSALGARIALHKACRGKNIKWIGANYTILHGGVRISIDAERIGKLTETVEKALAHRGLVPGVRSLAGELSWIAGLVPTIRPFVNMVWAALYGMDNQRNKATTGQSSARARPVGTVFAKTIRLPMIWMKKVSSGPARRPPERMGGILLNQRGEPVRWWAGPLHPTTLQELNVSAGEPGLMTVYELLAVVHIWQRLFRQCRLGLLVQLDSESALRVAVKLASPHPVVNRLAAEMALRLESLNAEALTGQHWRNVINLEADALSRLAEGKEVPARLRCLPRDQAVPLPLHTQSLAFDHRPSARAGEMLLRTSRSRAWKAVGLTMALVQAYRSSRRGQGGSREQERTDLSCSPAKCSSCDRKTPLGSPEDPTAKRVPLPLESATRWTDPVGRVRAGGDNSEIRQSTGPWRHLTRLETTPRVWELTRLIACQPYWERFLKQATSSESSSSGGSAGSGSAGGDGPDRTDPDKGGKEKKKRDGQEGDRPNPRTEGGGDKGDPPEGGEPGRPKAPPGVPDHAPICCSCNRSGTQALAHQREIVSTTLVTRSAGQGDSSHIAICLAPNPRGIIRGQDGSRRCGHTPCPRCTVQLEGQFMCTCCATRTRAAGSGLHGSGKLPPAEPGEEANRPRETGRGEVPTPRERSSRREEARREAPEPRERSSRKEEGRREAERDPGRREDRDGRGDPEKEAERGPGRRDDRDRRGETRDRSRARRRRRHPTERTYRSASEESEPGGGEEEEEVTEEEADYGRDDSPRSDTRRDRTPEKARDKAESWPAGSDRWCSVGCGRYCRAHVDTCCGACEDTAGMEHTRDCDRKNGYTPPPPRPYHKPPGRGGGGGPGWDRQGGGWGKPSSSKKASKAKRDYDRSVRRKQEGKIWGRAFPTAAFNQALTMGRAANTLKSWQARLRTWDAAAERLRREALLPPAQSATRLSPEEAKKVVALLKAQGYRSAELYLSAAMSRHRAHHQVDGPLTEAGREATRMAQRGRGPPAGKHPAPLPQIDHPQRKMLTTGVWYLLRVSEVIALTLEDVAIRQSVAGWTVALTIRSSKTDQEARSETVARDCVCLSERSTEAQLLCPAHILWEQAPLFTTEAGERLSERYVLSAVEQAAKEAGEPLKSNGRARFGTHSLRVAGAVLAFQAGLPEPVVRSLGRWRSERAMLAYLRGVPLVKASDSSGKMLRAMLDSGGGPLHNTNFRPLVQEGRMVWNRGKRAWETGTKDNKPEREEEAPEDGLQIRNNITGLVHRQGNLRGPAPGWTTRCGWKWASLDVAGSFGKEDGALCGKCFPGQG